MPKKKFLTNPSRSIVNFEIDNYEKTIEFVLNTIKEDEFKKELISILSEFILAHESTYIETKSIYLWNFFEHLTNLYSSKINKNLLIDDDKFSNLKEKIKDSIIDNLADFNVNNLIIDHLILSQKINRIINEFNKEMEIPIPRQKLRIIKEEIEALVESCIDQVDIIVEGYNKKKIIDLIINRLNQFPGILSLVNLMLENVSFDITEEESQLIESLYNIRNFFFHRSLKIEDMLEYLKETMDLESSDFNRQEFYKLVLDFEKFLMNLLFNFLEIPEEINNNQSSLSYEWFIYNNEITNKTPSEYFSNIFSNYLKKYESESFFANVIELVEKNIQNYETYKNSEIISGVYKKLDNGRTLKKVELQFKNKFEGYFRTPHIGFSQHPKEFEFLLFLCYKSFRLDSILRFKTPIISQTYDLGMLEFSSIYLDFLIWSNNLVDCDDETKRLMGSAITPLPKNFRKYPFLRECYQIPNEFKKALKEIDVKDPKIFPIFARIENRKEIERSRLITGIKNVKVKETDTSTILSFQRIITPLKKFGKGNIVNNEKFVAENSEPYLMAIPFLDYSGIFFITNSPDLFKIFYLIYKEKIKWNNEFFNESFLLELYIIAFYKIEKKKILEKEFLNKIRAFKNNEKVEFSIKKEEEIKIFYESFKRLIDLFAEISVYPGLKNLDYIKKKIEEIKKERLEPYLQEDFQGFSFLSFGLNLALYTYISGDKSLLNRMKDKDLRNLYNICKIIRGKFITREFIDRFFSFCDTYIDNHAIKSL